MVIHSGLLANAPIACTEEVNSIKDSEVLSRLKAGSFDWEQSQ